MKDVFSESLFHRQKKQFERINELSKAFAANYCGSTIIRDSIFSIVLNCARKRELELEILRYPFKDDELWAFTFIKKGVLFICINAELPLCKQIFATAHELYHIHCYAENINTETIVSGSLLCSRVFDEVSASQVDLEANAFAGLLLMPDASLIEQFRMYGMSKDRIEIDDVLTLMELSALPYKAVILRLVECDMISEAKAEELYKVDNERISVRIDLTGRAQQWQCNSVHLPHFGSLMDNLDYNYGQELLVESRMASDREYLKKIREEFLKGYKWQK